MALPQLLLDQTLADAKFGSLVAKLDAFDANDRQIFAVRDRPAECCAQARQELSSTPNGLAT